MLFNNTVGVGSLRYRNRKENTLVSEDKIKDSK